MGRDQQNRPLAGVEKEHTQQATAVRKPAGTWLCPQHSVQRLSCDGVVGTLRSELQIRVLKKKARGPNRPQTTPLV